MRWSSLSDFPGLTACDGSGYGGEIFLSLFILALLLSLETKGKTFVAELMKR